jgi:hypothetical protein
VKGLASHRLLAADDGRHAFAFHCRFNAGRWANVELATTESLFRQKPADRFADWIRRSADPAVLSGRSSYLVISSSAAPGGAGE